MARSEPIKFSQAARERMLSHAAEHRERAAAYLTSSRRYQGNDDETAEGFRDLAREHFLLYRDILARLGGAVRPPAQEAEDGGLERQLDTERARRRREEWARG